MGNLESGLALPGQTATISSTLSASGQAGLMGTMQNMDGSPLLATLAVYSSTPPSGLIFDAGGLYFDVYASGTDTKDVFAADFYYPNTFTGKSENKLRLAYFNGTVGMPVKSSGHANPVKNTEDDLDGTVSGGRFGVEFNNTSTPRITDLAGTVFALADTAPVINSVAGPGNPLPIGTSATVTVNFQAVGTPDSQRVNFAWDDGSSTLVMPSDAGTASASHLFAPASVNSALLTVTDANGDQATSQLDFVVV